MRTKPNHYRRPGNGHFALGIAIIVSGLALSAISSPVYAKAYRCKDASGNTSYSQSPCPADQTGAKVHGVNSTILTDREACKHIRRFAAEAFGELRSGKDSSMIIDEYGGPGYINPVTLNVVNFVSGFRFNENVSPLKVGAMAYNKCSNSGFGKIRTNDLPAEILPKYEQKPGTPEMAAPTDERYTQQAVSSEQATCESYKQRLVILNQAIQQDHGAANSQWMQQERQQYEALLREQCRR